MDFFIKLPGHLWIFVVPNLLMVLFIAVLFTVLLDRILYLLILIPKTFKTILTLFVLLITTKIGFYLFIGIPQCFNYIELQDIINIKDIDKIFSIAVLSLIGIYIMANLKKSLEIVMFDKPFNFKRFYGFWISLTGLTLSMGFVNQPFLSKFLHEHILNINSVAISIIMIVYILGCYVFFSKKNIEVFLDINIPSRSELLEENNTKYRILK